MSVRILLVAGALLLLLVTRTAHAQDPGVEQARLHFEAGQEHFEKGDFAKAAEEFMAAYAAKPYPAFLFNTAVCHERLNDYPKAVELFKRYLAEDPEARDKVDVEKRIVQLEAEIARAKEPPPDPENPDQPPPEVGKPLPEVKTKGLVVIESKPAGAFIYLDSKQKGALVGVTPWNGAIDGEHTLILEAKGFKTEKKKVAPGPDKLMYLYFALSEEHYLGFIEIRSNVPHSEVYIDRKEDGSVGTTPYMANIKPGPHTIWVTKRGHTEVMQKIEVERGKAQKLNVTIDVAPIGFIHVRGGGDATEGAKVWLDGKQVCAKLPCKIETSEGKHRLTVLKGGKKTMNKDLDIARTTETTLAVKLQPTPTRTDAILPILLGAGGIVGGYFLMEYSKDQVPDSDKEKGFRIGSYVSYGVGGLFLLQGIWYLFRDKGPPSTATVEAHEIGWVPAVGPGYAGMGAVVRF